jgi:diaminopimelate epimerase
MKVEYIKCHGSGNEFVMIDTVAQEVDNSLLSALSVAVCDRSSGIGADGILLLVKSNQGLYGMRMFNPDGSEAEMCGNGIRCIARLAEQYTLCQHFDLTSGGKIYPTARYAPVFGDIPTYGVEIGVKLWSEDFNFIPSKSGDFIGGVIEQLHPTLRWTTISVGNPHIVAVVESTDLELLNGLGERVKGLKDIFPNGVNISLVELRAENHIFVTTFERGAGITPSCGTAMTSSATAMALQGLCSYDSDIVVENRGGAVRCICSNKSGLKTTLIGNATYTEQGELDFDGKTFAFRTLSTFSDEVEAWSEFLRCR